MGMKEDDEFKDLSKMVDNVLATGAKQGAVKGALDVLDRRLVELQQDPRADPEHIMRLIGLKLRLGGTV